MSAARPWLFIDSARDYGGHEVMLTHFVEELARQNRVVPRVLAGRDTRLRQQIERFAAPFAFGTAGTSRLARVWSGWKDALVCMRAIRALQPELCIVAQGCILAQPACTTVAWLLGVPLVIYMPLVDSCTSMGFRTGKVRDWVTRHGYGNQPDAWITITEEQAKSFAAWAGVTRPIFTLSNTVEHAIERAPLNGCPPVAQVPRVLVLGPDRAAPEGARSLGQLLGRDPCIGWTGSRHVGRRGKFSGSHRRAHGLLSDIARTDRAATLVRHAHHAAADRRAAHPVAFRRRAAGHAGSDGVWRAGHRVRPAGHAALSRQRQPVCRRRL